MPQRKKGKRKLPPRDPLTGRFKPKRKSYKKQPRSKKTGLFKKR